MENKLKKLSIEELEMMIQKVEEENLVLKQQILEKIKIAKDLLEI